MGKKIMLVDDAAFMRMTTDVKESTIRQYVSGDVAPHIIGQIGKIYKEQWDEAIKDGAELVNGVTYAEIGGRKYAMNDVIGNSGAEHQHMLYSSKFYISTCFELAGA